MRFSYLALAAFALLPGTALAAAGDYPAAVKSTPASAASPGARPAKMRPRNALDRSSSDPGAATFISFDSNSDGHVSREEARESAELSRRFNQLDRNRDGRLSQGEVTGWRDLSYR